MISQMPLGSNFINGFQDPALSLFFILPGQQNRAGDKDRRIGSHQYADDQSESKIMDDAASQNEKADQHH